MTASTARNILRGKPSAARTLLRRPALKVVVNHAPIAPNGAALLVCRSVEIDLGLVEGQPLSGRIALVDVDGHARGVPTASAADIAAAEADCLAWGQRVGLAQADGGRYLKKFCMSGLASLSAYSLPGVSLERSRVFIHLQAFFVTLDDVLDNLVDIGRIGPPLDYARLGEVFDLFADVLAGRHIDADRARQLRPVFPMFETFVLALDDLHFEARNCGLDLSDFIDSMRAYFDAVAWEHASAATGGATAMASYLRLREETITYWQSIECFLLIQGLPLPAGIRQRALYTLLRQAACQHVSLVNDLMSLAKEIANGERHNAMFVGAETRRLDTRFAELLAQVDGIGHEFARLATRFEQAHRAEPSVRAFVQLLLDSVNGHIAWYAASKRYGTVVRG